MPFRRMMRFLIAQPVRVSIAQNLDWADLDIEERTMIVGSEAVGNKSRRALTLPLSSMAIEVLEA